MYIYSLNLFNIVNPLLQLTPSIWTLKDMNVLVLFRCVVHVLLEQHCWLVAKLVTIL